MQAPSPPPPQHVPSQQKTRKLPPLQHGAAGFVAGFAATSLLYPLDVVKTRFQSESTRVGFDSDCLP